MSRRYYKSSRGYRRSSILGLTRTERDILRFISALIKITVDIITRIFKSICEIYRYFKR